MQKREVGWVGRGRGTWDDSPAREAKKWESSLDCQVHILFMVSLSDDQRPQLDNK